MQDCEGGVGFEWPPGAYGRIRGEWHAVTPNGLFAGLALHQVTEHPDGTITVEPSILADWGDDTHQYHGWLRAGVWTEA